MLFRQTLIALDKQGRFLSVKDATKKNKKASTKLTEQERQENRFF